MFVYILQLFMGSISIDHAQGRSPIACSIIPLIYTIWTVSEDVYMYGRGVTKDVNQAREWYTKAVARGSAGAQTELDSLNASN